MRAVIIELLNKYYKVEDSFQGGSHADQVTLMCSNDVTIYSDVAICMCSSGSPYTLVAVMSSHTV